MWACRAIVKVGDEFVDSIADAVKEEYPRSSTVRIERIQDDTYATFHIKTRETCGAVDARLRGIRGATVLYVSDIRAELPSNLKTRSFWTMVTMFVGWVVFIVIGFIVPDSPLALLNPAQMFVVQTTFTLALAILVYTRDREAAHHISGQVSGVYALASEINERIRAQAEKNR